MMIENASEAERIAELEADNRRLRRLLDQRDAPGELRHRLRSTLAMLRTVIRRTAETEREFDGYVAHLEDRLDALMRAQAAADGRGSIDLHGVLSDELLHYGIAEDGQAKLSGPRIELRPRAGQVLAMAVHELVVNGIEHGQLNDRWGRVEVVWRLDDAEETGPWLTICWKEHNPLLTLAPAREGFGTNLLHQMLGYELKAQTSLAFERDGFRCTIRLPLTENVGRQD